MNKFIKKLVNLILIFTLFICNIIYAGVNIDPFRHLYRHENKPNTNLNDNMITFDEIDDLVFYQNPIVRNMWNNYNTHDDVDEIADTYYDAADAIEGMGDDEVSEASNFAKAAGLRVLGDNNVSDSNIMFLQNLMQEKNIIYNTKVAYINYQKSIVDREKAVQSRDEAKRLLGASDDNLSVGNITRSEHLKTKNSYYTADSNVILADSELIKNKRNILINCGYNIDDNIEIFPQGHVSIDAVNNAINLGLSNNIQEAKNNSIKYEIYKKSLENARSEEMKNTHTINVTNAEKYIEADVKNKYLNLQDAYTNYKNKSNDITYFRREYNLASDRLNEGSISKNEYKTMQYNYNISIVDQEIAYYELDIAYLAYLNTIEGMANAGVI